MCDDRARGIVVPGRRSTSTPPRDNGPCNAIASSTGRWAPDSACSATMACRRTPSSSARRGSPRRVVCGTTDEGPHDVCRNSARHAGELPSPHRHVQIERDTVRSSERRTALTGAAFVPSRLHEPRIPPRRASYGSDTEESAPRERSIAGDSFQAGGRCDPMSHAPPPCTGIPAPRPLRRALRAATEYGRT